jgi:hypothetical protein
MRRSGCQQIFGEIPPTLDIGLVPPVTDASLPVKFAGRASKYHG